MIESANNSADWLRDFDKAGFALLPDVLAKDQVLALIEEVAAASSVSTSARSRGREEYAMRNLLENVPAVQMLAHSPQIRALVEPVLGTEAFAVRGLLFDKTPEANWKVAWHQDVSIAVRQRVEIAGFGPWSTKAGVLHVQPPATILENMLTVRLHLDDCGEENGPLQVIPGSHRAGRLTADEIKSYRERISLTVCLLKRGGVLLMRPLLLHASSSAQTPGHRRVIHLEFARDNLPNGLPWISER